MEKKLRWKKYFLKKRHEYYGTIFNSLTVLIVFEE